jgi:hypothetical protein
VKTLSPDSKSFFPARVISSVVGGCSRTARRRARREGWPLRQRGNLFEYEVPRNLRRRCAALSPVPPIWDQPRTIRELLRAAAILGFCRRIQRNPRHGIERALQETASDFRHLLKFSTRTLRAWISAVERGGLTALREQKVGRVGRKSNRLESVL